jgi:lipid-binding SYLF domain-containing protein
MSASRLPVLLALVTLALVARPIAQEDVRESDRVKTAITVLDEVMSASDSAVPGSILERAEAIAVFPSLVKAGFVVGGSRGHGVISVRDPKSGAWSSPAFLTVTGGSIGFQIGAQAVDLVLVVQNRRGLDQLLKNQFKIGADASVAAGPVGRDASASTDIQLRAQILSYSRTRGLFAGVTINGSTIRQDRDANERFYGIAYRTGQVVTQRLGGSPEPSGEWRAALAKYASGTP